MVEVEGTERLVPACNTRVVEGMSIHTNTPRVREARKTNLRLILSQHNSTCTTCISDGTAVVDAGGAKREVSSELLEDLEPGDYVMVHAGVAIAKITEEDDEETDQLMEELL